MTDFVLISLKATMYNFNSFPCECESVLILESFLSVIQQSTEFRVQMSRVGFPNCPVTFLAILSPADGGQEAARLH